MARRRNSESGNLALPVGEWIAFPISINRTVLGRFLWVAPIKNFALDCPENGYWLAGYWHAVNFLSALEPKSSVTRRVSWRVIPSPQSEVAAP